MTDIVPADQIEMLVGARRHEYMHLAKFDTDKGLVYILHPTECVTSTADLRACRYSQALDHGVLPEDWIGFMNVPVTTTIHQGKLYATGKYTPRVGVPGLPSVGD